MVRLPISFYLLLALVPLGIGLYFGKRFEWYEALISFVFIFFMFDGQDYRQALSLIVYIIYQMSGNVVLPLSAKEKQQFSILHNSFSIITADHHREVYACNGWS